MLMLPMRELLKKGVKFNWTIDLQMAFEKCREFLSSPAVIKPYDPSLPTELLTDASRLHGLGFALLQRRGESVHLVQAGSRSITQAEKNYASIELECLGVQWAISQCDFYLKGCPHFTVITDHKPLLGIFNKSIVDIENDRLRRLREKLMHYTFSITWSAGKEHLIADALSRRPVWEAEKCAVATVDLSPHVADLANDGAFAFVREGAKAREYRHLVECIKGDRAEDSGPFRKYFDNLSIHPCSNGVDLVLMDERIVVPADARRTIMRVLHKAHLGKTKTYERARQAFFWPGMKNDLDQVVEACEQCQQLRPAEQDTPMRCDVATAPMEKVGADLFSFAGKEYFVLVDRFSGYPLVRKLSSTTTTAVTNVMEEWFAIFGYPKTIRTDGGP